jgi:hypothetical protein
MVHRPGRRSNLEQPLHFRVGEDPVQQLFQVSVGDILDQAVQLFPQQLGIDGRRSNEIFMVHLFVRHRFRLANHHLQLLVVALDLTDDRHNVAGFEHLSQAVDILPHQRGHLAGSVTDRGGEVRTAAPPLADVRGAHREALLDLRPGLEILDPGSLPPAHGPPIPGIRCRPGCGRRWRDDPGTPQPGIPS